MEGLEGGPRRAGGKPVPAEEVGNDKVVIEGERCTVIHTVAEGNWILAPSDSLTSDLAV